MSVLICMCSVYINVFSILFFSITYLCVRLEFLYGLKFVIIHVILDTEILVLQLEKQYNILGLFSLNSGPSRFWWQLI